MKAEELRPTASRSGAPGQRDVARWPLAGRPADSPSRGLMDVILVIVGYRPGVTDAQLAAAIFGRRRGALITLECGHLAELGELRRALRTDGLIGNYRPDRLQPP